MGFDPPTFGLPANIARWEYVRFLAASFDTSDQTRRDLLLSENDVIEESLEPPHGSPEALRRLLSRPVGPLPEMLDLMDSAGTMMSTLDEAFDGIVPIAIDSASRTSSRAGTR